MATCERFRVSADKGMQARSTHGLEVLEFAMWAAYHLKLESSHKSNLNPTLKGGDMNLSVHFATLLARCH